MEEFERIIVGTDGSDHAEVAVARAFSLAKVLEVPVVAMYVVDPVTFQGFPPEGLVADMTKILTEEAEEVMETIRQRGERDGVKVVGLIKEGRPAEELCQEATPKDLIVVATHGRRGLGRILLGSVAENVVRHAPCPVLVIRDTRKKKEKAADDE